MNCDHISNINKIMNDALSGIAESAETAGATAISALDSYREAIRDFFSTTNGEGAGIKALYTKANDIFNGTKQVSASVQDLNMALHLYMEFLDGMRGFIDNEIASAKNTNVDVTAEAQKIAEITGKDKDFIDSIFTDGGANKTVNIIPLREGLKNLEVLIDFLPMIDDMKERINTINDSDTDISAQLTQFYGRSVVDFSGRMILAVIETYKTLNGEKCCVENPAPTNKFADFKLL